MSELLVSVIVPTRNSQEMLGACLYSIRQQSYKNIELIVVDRASEDDTQDIAKQYTQYVFTKGPERSAQRNFGVSVSKGQYVLIIDSDMELSKHVIKACIDKVQKNLETRAVIIPEESFGIGFWAQCKRLERSYYVGVDGIEAARFFEKSLYQQQGGYDEEMVSGEDWDLSGRASEITKIGRVNEFILHNEGKLKLSSTLKKKYYYAGLSRTYLEKQNVQTKLTSSVGPIERYKLFFTQPGKLFRNPVTGMGMLFMKTCEFGFGAIGYVKSKYV